MSQYFPPRRDFSSLSVLDLLEAREAYHVHLAHLENVVATAIGRYRIRVDDPDAKEPVRRTERSSSEKEPGPRTLQNTVVQPWSWPCVMVFVNKWLPRADFAKNPDQMVPRSLYLPDGRVVPTCVLYVEEGEAPEETLPKLNFPSNLLGGGYVAVADVQGREHASSMGCLVTDGDQTYVLTNRHVVGAAGREIYTIVRHDRLPVGRADERQVGKVPFEEAYPGWPGPRSFANLDAGLIRIEDVTRWTTQIFGVGELALPVDLNPDTISLDLTGCPVRAFGAASGALVGEIQALFYRYRSIGGADYISDLLIGARTGSKETMRTLPGDSGTIWVFDPPADAEGKPKLPSARNEKAAKRIAGPASPAVATPRLRPIAMQWGGHVVMESATRKQFHFALATCLSTVCRALEVDVVRDWQTGRPEYWGQRGHYTVGGKACELLSNSKLKRLMKANLERISFDEATITSGGASTDAQSDFYPLSDVPDTVWKVAPYKRAHENPNHFADMDEPGTGAFAGKDLFKVCEDADNVDPKVWNEFYESLDVSPSHQGCLPFRVWQLYDAMVAAVSEKDVARFVGVAGVLAHYVGDACQPLHTSRLHDGTPGNDEEEGVHSAYETKMIDRFKGELYAGLNTTLAGKTASAEVQGGQQAAVSLVKLCRASMKALPPREIIDAYVEGNHRIDKMWAALGARTIKVIAGGCLHLAMLWESAWAEGGGDSIAQGDLIEIGKAQLRKLYRDPEFVRSLYLPEMSQSQTLGG